MDSIISSIAPLKAVPQTTPDSAKPFRQPTDGFDAARFSQLMEAQAPVAHSPTSVDAASPVPPVTGDGIGDKMLARMTTMGAEFNKTWHQVTELVTSPEGAMSMQDMLKAQMHLIKVSGEYEVIGKVIGKSTQNVDQMLRMQ